MSSFGQAFPSRRPWIGLRVRPPDRTGSPADADRPLPDPVGRTIVACCGVLLPTVGSFAGGSAAAIFLGTTGVLVLLATVRDRRFPLPDLPLLGCLALLVSLGAASVLWSVEPDRSLRMAVQIALILSLLALAFSPRLAALCGPTGMADGLAAGIGLGALLLVAEFLLGHPVLRFLKHVPADGMVPLFEYKRGLTYGVVLAWPAAARAWTRNRRAVAVGLVAAAFALAMLVHARTAAGAAVVGLGVLGLAAAWPRLVRIGLAGTILTLAFACPFLLSELADPRWGLIERLPVSAGHRLEIWHYIATAILSHPILGWGLNTSSQLPVAIHQLSGNQYALALASHPHNVFLQVWVELGLAGILALCSVVLLVLRRIGRMPAHLQLFALACCASAFCIAMLSFETWSDSWLATLAAAGFAFFLLHHETGHETGRPGAGASSGAGTPTGSGFRPRSHA